MEPVSYTIGGGGEVLTCQSEWCRVDSSSTTIQRSLALAENYNHVNESTDKAGRINTGLRLLLTAFGELIGHH